MNKFEPNDALDDAYYWEDDILVPIIKPKHTPAQQRAINRRKEEHYAAAEADKVGVHGSPVWQREFLRILSGGEPLITTSTLGRLNEALELARTTGKEVRLR